MREYSFEEIRNSCADKKVLIVSYEAGASQILGSMMVRLHLSNVRYILEGPAIKIFEKKLGTLILEDLTEDLVRTCDLVITGTSLIPELERRAIKLAQQAGVKVCSVIDHWVNYRQRFTSIEGGGGVVNFPDETWVCDEQAVAAASREGLPEEHIRKIENYYFTSLQGKSWPTDSGRVLYVCEPVFDDVKLLTGNGNAWGYNEFELVKDFLSNLEKMDGIFKKAVLRLHPNETQDKYDELLKKYSGRIPLEISSVDFRSIEEDCSRAEVIVGVESMALVIGLHFGKKVFSCLPDKAKKQCQLPHREILHIRSFAEVGTMTND
ncbi:MAG: hypothetical protein KA403_02490 [Candidatus Omnitrophica bacterium]|nr:hypothetical protein [Candidatus Omnitrophota bacterium]